VTRAWGTLKCWETFGTCWHMDVLTTGQLRLRIREDPDDTPCVASWCPFCGAGAEDPDRQDVKIWVAPL